MERFRRRKSRKSAVIEGNQQIQKDKTIPKPATECRSCGRPIAKEVSELNNSNRVTVTPMKKLLAEEMSKEADAKRQSPSIIARLMGLDGLPDPQSVHRHKKTLFNDYELRTASLGFERNAPPYCRSSRKSSMEQQEFKDVYVYEDLEMALIQQKFMESNHLSTDEWVRGSREFHDTLDMLNSNKDLMLKFLQQPDSLFVKHMHDLKGAPSSSLYSQGTSRMHASSSRRKHEDGLLSHSHNGRSAHISPKARLEVKDETNIFPANIVVLKPNLGKMCNAGTSVSSPYSSPAYPSGYRRHMEYSSDRSGEAGSRGKQVLTNEVGSSRHKSKEAKDLAKKIPRRMRRASGSRPNNISFGGSGGYAGDESSYSISGSDSGGESEVMTLASRNSFDWNNQNSSRSRSVPPLFGIRSPKASAQREAFVDERLLRPKEAMNQGRAKAVKGTFTQKEDYSPKNIRSSKRRSDSVRHRYAYNTDSSPEICPSQNLLEIKVSQTPNGVSSTSSVIDSVANTEYESIPVPSSASDEFLPELSMCISSNGDSSAYDQEDSNSQEPSIGPSVGGTVVNCPGPEPESLGSSKETDQPSPVSVLEVPCLEGASYGSECFERVSADLHELRLNCQLLKMESEPYPEVPTFLPFNEEDERSLTVSPPEEIFSSKSWESLYLSAVLVESGFTENDPNMFTTTWHSRDYPLAPWVFDDLEKYCDESHAPKLHRRLLFDRINSAFSEIFNRLVDPCPWVGPIGGTRGSKKQNRGVKEEIEQLLARQVEEANVDLSEKLLDREMNWLDFRGQFDAVGMELEKLLMDDLVMEVFVRGF